MEHSTNVISTRYLDQLCYKDGEQYKFYPSMLDLFEDRKPPVFIPEIYMPFITPGTKEYHSRHQQLYGGSGSGKSRFLATKFLLKAMGSTYFRLLYVRLTHNSIKSSTFQLFKDIIAANGWTHLFRPNETSYDIRCVLTGHLLMASGLDNVTKLQSVADPTDIWIEEGVGAEVKENITYKAYTELLRRLRTPLAETHLHSSYNPINKASFYYQKFFRVQVYPADQVSILRTTYKDNPFVPESYRKERELEVLINPDEAAIYTFGRWGDSESKGRWVRTYKSAIHLSNDINETGFIPNLDVDLSYDFNVVPYMTLLCIQLIERKKWKRDHLTGLTVLKTIIQIRIFKEYCLSNPLNSAEAVTQAFVNDYVLGFGPMPVRYYGDATGDYGVPGVGSKDVASRYIAIVNKLKEYDLWHNSSKGVQKGNPYGIDARELVEDILAGKYDIEVIIDEDNCPNLAEDLASLQEGPKGFDKAKDKKGVERRGHCYSALKDYLCSVFKPLLKQRGTRPENETDE